MTQKAIGVDLGGTNLRWGVIDASGQKLFHDQVLRPKQPDEIVAAIRHGILACLDRYPDAKGAGVAVPGIVKDGQIISVNLGWIDFNLEKKLAGVRVPVAVLNDMSAGALGELHFGRARGLKNIVFITVSTGIGAGIIINGQVYKGTDGHAGEVGHMVVDLNGLLCGCGRRGCWEMIASGTAHKRRIKEAFASGTWANETVEPTPAEVTEQAALGDKAAKALVLRTARYLGIGVANLANLYDPEAVIFTGGFARNTWELIHDYLEQEVHEQSFSQNVKLLLTELGDDAGLLGAAAYTLRA
jgi:glucokinase